MFLNKYQGENNFMDPLISLIFKKNNNISAVAHEKIKITVSLK